MGLWKKVKKAAKKAGRAAAKVVKYGAPIAGGLVLGPLGAAAGTALAAGASQVGPNKNRGAALKRTLVYGGGVTAGTAVLGLASGAGAGSSVINSVSRIFGGSPASVSDQPKSLLDEAKFGNEPGQGPQGGSNFDLLRSFNPFGQAPGARGGDASPGDPRQGGGFLDFLSGGQGESPGFFQKQDGSPDLLKIGGAGFLAWWLFLRKKAA